MFMKPVAHPLHLYRAIMREHRFLPKQMKGIGDAYVKQEFQFHKNVEPGAQLQQFMAGWNKYLLQIQKQRLSQGKFNDAISEEQIKNKLSAEQQEKLNQLKTELNSSK